MNKIIRLRCNILETYKLISVVHANSIKGMIHQYSELLLVNTSFIARKGLSLTS